MRLRGVLLAALPSFLLLSAVSVTLPVSDLTLIPARSVEKPLAAEDAANPEYPEQYSALGFRLGVNYLVDSMTH